MTQVEDITHGYFTAKFARSADAEYDDEDSLDPPVSADVHWEGPPLTCDECGGLIESAYGDPGKEEG